MHCMSCLDSHGTRKCTVVPGSDGNAEDVAGLLEDVVATGTGKPILPGQVVRLHTKLGSDVGERQVHQHWTFY